NFTDALPLVKYYSENNKRLIHFSTCEVAFILPCRELIVSTLIPLSMYKWMTFGEVGTARSAIGSGLIYYGIPKGAVLTHANFVENVAGTTMDENFGPSDV
ncbi:hypothetical protein S83_032099, partial [Arachis hypogaea]